MDTVKALLFVGALVIVLWAIALHRIDGTESQPAEFQYKFFGSFTELVRWLSYLVWHLWVTM